MKYSRWKLSDENSVGTILKWIYETSIVKWKYEIENKLIRLRANE